ncbi:MarR family transcriptional regulator [Jannaschia sp. EhC01]|uniref:MarR family transcriptional regulator n=1 Tax=Gymnodinialimonas phycosphaerae TaxID=2841589 RepID=A0A975YF35_9RHOB|nr:MarR family transcriptional regulator [Gymnodinialimonas phycosphaerae]MBY4894353.1 MarR family transcriptional regulator [Gymnodinialimonas phycosphaerae]OAN76053.1 MarR family transcriptional regulator [Jannaschia sp. EhC01]
MSKHDDPLSVALFSEVFMIDQLARARLSKALPKGMELSHFSVLNHLVASADEKTPAQLARAFHLTRGAMTNTLNKLEWAGHIHVRPDWDDARRKLISISPAGRRAREAAISAIVPILTEAVAEIGPAKVRDTLPLLREVRRKLEDEG